MRLYFTINSSIVEEDWNTIDLEVGKIFTDPSFELYSLSNIKETTSTATKLEYIYDNFYNITAYIYHINLNYIFVEINGMMFIIHKSEEQSIKTIGYYTFDGFICNDTWNFFAMYESKNDTEWENYCDEFELTGIIQSIKINCMEDEKIVNGSFDYLIELEVDNIKAIRRKFVYTLANLAR